MVVHHPSLLEGPSLEAVHNLVEAPNLVLDRWEWDLEDFHMVQRQQGVLCLEPSSQLCNLSLQLNLAAQVLLQTADTL